MPSADAAHPPTADSNNFLSGPGQIGFRVRNFDTVEGASDEVNFVMEEMDVFFAS